MRELIILFFVLTAVWALLVAGHRRLRRAAYAWGIAALGAVAGLILNSAAERHIPAEVHNSVVTQFNPTPVDPQAPTVPPPPASKRDATQADQQLQPLEPVSAHVSGVSSETYVSQRPVPTPTLSKVQQSGVSVAIRGRWSPLDPTEVESAVIGELRNAGWSGFTSGGEKVLTIDGTLRDLDLTLGQIPTATVSLHWSLRSSNGGALIAQGGISDVRGTSLEQSAAEVAAVQRAAHQLSQTISGDAP